LVSCYAGFVTFFDPPMEGVPETLRALRRDGVEVKILTGDNELVVHHVCGQVGLDSAASSVANEIERMTDSALAAVATHTSRPRLTAQKTGLSPRSESNHVVGFLGDGHQRRALHPHGGHRVSVASRRRRRGAQGRCRHHPARTRT